MLKADFRIGRSTEFKWNIACFLDDRSATNTVVDAEGGRTHAFAESVFQEPKSFERTPEICNPELHLS